MRRVTKWHDLGDGVKAGKWCGGEVRAYRPPPGYSAQCELIETHPVTGKALESEWWVFLTPKKGN